ncbi:zinc-ribbon domain-containing protein [Brevibacillus daliensis]|uniref:zinc-ribbon domain-containing protein n=1 Tax=Brevibacillus daliensis TaxID=2892995 RepID=UPI001E5F45BC|nr:zinc-ribbon domain-containing protein [Brevibacillus daliensis]
MKSIKPGRGPSSMGVMGSVVTGIFGVFWTIMAFQITQDSPFGLVGFIFPFFGVLFIIISIVQGIYHYKNATSKNRMSIVDIVDSNQEPDPLDRHRRSSDDDHNPYKRSYEPGAEVAGQKAKRFCPYCGTETNEDYQYCPSCGKKL